MSFFSARGLRMLVRPSNQSIAQVLPDLPRWIEVRDLLLSDDCEIFGLDEPRIGIDTADRLHREHDPSALREERVLEHSLATAMRIPAPVQPAESRGRQRFVDRCVVVDPWVAFRDTARESRELRRELRIDETRVVRTAAVMNQPGNDAHSCATNEGKAIIGPRPRLFVRSSGRNSLPQHGVAQGTNAELTAPFDVIAALGVTVALELVEPAVIDAIDRAFDTAPHLDAGGGIATYDALHG